MERAEPGHEPPAPQARTPWPIREFGTAALPNSAAIMKLGLGLGDSMITPENMKYCAQLGVTHAIYSGIFINCCMCGGS